MLEAHRILKTWDKIDAYVALTDFVQRILVAGGLPSERVYVKPNFIAAVDAPVRTGPGEYALYVGRLVPEKGLRTLVEAWSGAYGGLPLEIPLKLVGTGPMEAELKEQHAIGGGRIEFLGYRPRNEVAQMLENARFLVYPSVWYEPFGIATIEALAAGVPAVVSDSGGIGELIEHGKTGLHVVPGDAASLARAARQLSADLEGNERMGAAARCAYLTRYTPAQNYDRLLQIYQAAQERRRQVAGR
jgi:glycosyltransferase involved in cell wall biosynthesis